MRRLTEKRRLLGLMLAATCGGAVWAATFQWTGEGATANWKNADNWDVTGFGACLFPCTTADDVVYPVESGGWGTVLLDFSSEGIDTLTVEEDVDFDGDTGAGTAILKCERMIIKGGSNGVTVTFASDAVVTSADT